METCRSTATQEGEGAGVTKSALSGGDDLCRTQSSRYPVRETTLLNPTGSLPVGQHAAKAHHKGGKVGPDGAQL